MQWKCKCECAKWTLKFHFSGSIVPGSIWLKRTTCKRFILTQAPWLEFFSTFFYHRFFHICALRHKQWGLWDGTFFFAFSSVKLYVLGQLLTPSVKKHLQASEMLVPRLSLRHPPFFFFFTEMCSMGYSGRFSRKCRRESLPLYRTQSTQHQRQTSAGFTVWKIPLWLGLGRWG